MAKESDVKIINGKICVTSAALYELLGIAESTLVRWGQAGCPKASRGWWVIKDVLEWKGLAESEDAKEYDDETIKDKPLTFQKAYFETRLKEAQCEATDLKNAIAKGDYIPKNEIVEQLKRFFVVLKRSMTGYSKKIATELSFFVEPAEARKIEKLINEITTNALDQLSIEGVYSARNFRKENQKS